MSRNVYTHHITDTGVVVRVYFCVGIGAPQNRDWHYFGITSADIAIPEATYNSYNEHTYVQFPTDFSELTDLADQYLYEMAMIAGLHKAGVPE